MVRCRTVAKVLSNGVRRSQVLPVLGCEVVERQQRIAVLGQAIGSSLVFELVGFDKGFQGCNGILLGLGQAPSSWPRAGFVGAGLVG
jgi:hypothetical protein